MTTKSNRAARRAAESNKAPPPPAATIVDEVSDYLGRYVEFTTPDGAAFVNADAVTAVVEGVAHGDDATSLLHLVGGSTIRVNGDIREIIDVLDPPPEQVQQATFRSEAERLSQGGS